MGGWDLIFTSLLSGTLGAGLISVFQGVIGLHLRRRGVAGLLYIELRQIRIYAEAIIRTLDSKGLAPAVYGLIPTPAYDAHSGELASLFRPKLADAVAIFYGRVAAFNAVLGEFRTAAKEYERVQAEFTVTTRELSSGQRQISELAQQVHGYAQQVVYAADDVETGLKKLAPRHAAEQVERLREIINKSLQQGGKARPDQPKAENG